MVSIRWPPIRVLTPITLGELVHCVREGLGLIAERGEVETDGVEQGRVLLAVLGMEMAVERLRAVAVGEEVVVEVLQRDFS